VTPMPRATRLRRYLTFDDWPASDRAAWSGAFTATSLLAPASAATRWSDATIKMNRFGYSRWLGWLVKRNQLKGYPSQRVTPKAVRAYINEHFQAKLSGHTIILYVSQLLAVISVFAPERDWGWLKAKVAHLWRGHPRPREKLSHLIHPRVLLQTALAAMDQVIASEDGDEEQAPYFRDLLCVAILACRPIRRRNLAMIEIGRHLAQRGERWYLQFESEETKTQEPLHHELPAVLSPHIATYLSRFRARLLGPTISCRLWINRYGNPMDGMSIYRRIVNVTPDLCGKRLWPHLFRDSSATSLALDDPAHIGIITDVLGHGSSKTAQRHYNRARMIDYSRQYQATVIAARRRARRLRA
jgi:integrase/recombinase XerD